MNKIKNHHYEINMKWTGNRGDGTTRYASYSRDHVVSGIDKYGSILGSSDPAFLGDKSRYNPEDLFISSLSACHMLWYLHLCSVHTVTVTDYVDRATGIMEEYPNGSGKFKEIILNPTVTIQDQASREQATSLHDEAHKMCFLANSCAVNIVHKPKIIIP